MFHFPKTVRYITPALIAIVSEGTFSVSFAGKFAIGGKENKQWIPVGNRLGSSISYKFGGRKENIPFIAYHKKYVEIFYG